MEGLLLPLSHGQAGCTDPQALNYEATATTNDGSCLYSPTSYSLLQLAELPTELDECSGMEFINGKLWVHEDSGTPAELFHIDSLSGELLQTLLLPATQKTDWEDLAESSTHLFVGDFGNNSGDRTDLRILMLPKSGLADPLDTPAVIQFSFGDQTDFTPAYHANDYDCEAFFYWNDSLHIFSKDWVDLKTRHYVLPATPGTYVAQVRGSLEVNGQISAADISDDGKALLLGYNFNTGEVFLWLLFDFPGNDVFLGNKRRITLGSVLSSSQAEGIAFRNNTYGYICAERYSLLPQRLLSFDIRQWVENTNAARVRVPPTATVSPNPFRDYIQIDFAAPTADCALFDAQGHQLGRWAAPGPLLRIPTDQWVPGFYLLTVRQGSDFSVHKVIKVRS